MKRKSEHVLLIILIIGCFLLTGILGRVFIRHIPRPYSTFELQKKYSDLVENKLVRLLEPATGIGNIRASVQAEIRNKNTTQTQFDFSNVTKSVVHEKGPVLVVQSVSVLINETNKNRLPIYQNLIKGAVGFDAERGDTLAVEMLPFVKVPYWTLGLEPICLIRIGAGLILLILLGLFWLAKEIWIKPKETPASYHSNENLWRQVAEIPAPQLVSLLKTARPEISAFILYKIPQEKASRIIELLPQNYMSQVVLHLDYIEKLAPSDKIFLLQETEEHLKEMLKAIHFAKSTEPENHFDSLKNWSDVDLQNLLHYVSQKDLEKALQKASLSVQRALSRNIPPALWQSLIQQSPCSEKESLQAQEKIMNLAKLLKENI